MVLITLQYVPIDFKAAFLSLKEEEIALPYYQWTFFGHVYSSIFVLIIGMFQLSKSFRNQFTYIHRLFGKVYIGLILLIAAPSGFVIGYHANGHLSSQLSFMILAVLWFYFTYKSFIQAKNKNWIKHRNFMWRSYALTLSAISLRLFKWIIVSTIELGPMDTYQIVSWTGWLVNLIIVESYILYLSKD
ncbi:putative membrane protein DUF2306 [Nonlabens dokdonensis]|jgi:uncharacterized membrane protein|uniref:Membrane protein DUF2306 n=2 Tax=Nonlabens dokdonensis TaxID=328515 RepID=A0ABX5PVU8_9FLAO|nr:DUF2306 domain-containing protein [Nonlabens dokdonensis]AGC78413.1 putative membrane protein [Nonlabens dokdonensis DSW-6]PZX38161.1 putative membrane protein DUF2306 [Nonlabens dokdonensis]